MNMAESSLNLEAEDVSLKGEDLPAEGSVPLTMPTQTLDEGSPDLFTGVEGKETGSQPEGEDAVKPTTVKEKPINKHSMVTRSKLGSSIKRTVSGRHRSFGKGSSRYSNVTRSSMLSTHSVLSDSQLQNLYAVEKTNRQKRLQLEIEQVERRFCEQENVMQKSTLREDEELEEEERKLEAELVKRRQELVQKHRDILLNRRKQQDAIESQRDSTIRELNDRGQRECMEIEADFCEEFVRRGISTTDVPLQHNGLGKGMASSAVGSPEPGTVIATVQHAVNVVKQPRMSLNIVPSTKSNATAVAGVSNVTGMSVCSPGVLDKMTQPMHARFTPGVDDVSEKSVLSACVTTTLSNAKVSNTCSAPKTSLPNRALLTEANCFPKATNQVTNSGVSALKAVGGSTPGVTGSHSTGEVAFNLGSQCAAPADPNENPAGNTSGTQTIIVKSMHNSGPPPSKPPVFGGNPTEYRNFKSAFQTIICKNVSDPDERMQYLLQFTKGTAHAMVKACQNSDAKFDKAMGLLEQNFGQKHQIGHACISSLVHGPQLKLADRESLSLLSAELMSCEGTLDAIGYGAVPLLTVNQVASRLPVVWNPGWLTLVDNVLNIQDRHLTFGDLASYVTKKTREISNIPADESSSTSRSMSNQTKAMKPFKSSFATTGNTVLNSQTSNPENNKTCLKCGAKHYLNQCLSFRNLSYKLRKEFVRKHELCFACFESDHWQKDCPREKPCYIQGCNGKHATLLHPPDNYRPNYSIVKHVETKEESKSSSVEPEEKNSENKQGMSAFMASSDEEKVLLNVIPVKVRAGDSKTIVETRCFFDSGSTCSFISESLVEKLGVVGMKTGLSIKTILDKVEQRESSVIRGIEMSDFDESQFVPLNQLFSTKRIDIDERNIPTQHDVDQFCEFRNVDIPEIESDVGLLIGKDHEALHKPLEVVYGPRDHFAMRTIAGWMVSCPRNVENPGKSCTSCFVKTKQFPLCQMCTEFLDSTSNEKTELSPNQELFMERVENSIKLTEDSHYEMDLPLIDPKINLPSNKEQVRYRTIGLKRRFLRENNFYLQYRVFMQTMILLGFVEKVVNLEGPKGQTWYLSHHGVYHPEKGTIRVVHDCSAKYHGVCLNEVLLQGPDLANNLMGVLCRFRKQSIAIQGDIQSMFLQVKVSEIHRDFLRFFWWKDGNHNQPLEEYRMKVFLFGTVCSPSCANLALKRTASDNADDYEPSVVSAVLDSFYVDDFLDSRPSPAQAIEHLNSVASLVAKGGFKLTNR